MACQSGAMAHCVSVTSGRGRWSRRVQSRRIGIPVHDSARRALAEIDRGRRRIANARAVVTRAAGGDDQNGNETISASFTSITASSLETESVEVAETVTTETVTRTSIEDENGVISESSSSEFDVSEGTVWRKTSSSAAAFASTEASVTSSKGVSETSLSKTLGGFAKQVTQGSPQIQLNEKTVEQISGVVAASSVGVVAVALGSVAVGVSNALETVPLLQGFEEAVGIAVSAYYANKLSGNFVTATGREQFRLRLVENFTKITGKGSPVALAGKLARSDKELDAQIKGLIGDLKSADRDNSEELPESLRNAIATFIRNRDGSVRSEIDALRGVNSEMRTQVDAIEMLQNELLESRRETTFARANIKVMNLDTKEREKLERELRLAKAEGEAFSEAMRKEMASMAADAATESVKAREALARKERELLEALASLEVGRDAPRGDCPSVDSATDDTANAEARALAATKLAASAREIKELKEQLANAKTRSDEVISGMETSAERDLRNALAEAEKRRERELAAAVEDSRDLILEERRSAAAVVKQARAAAADDNALAVTQARLEAVDRVTDKDERRFAEELAVATAAVAETLAATEAELEKTRTQVEDTKKELAEAKRSASVAAKETGIRVNEAVAAAEAASGALLAKQVEDATGAKDEALADLTAELAEFEKKADEKLRFAVASTLQELADARAEANELRKQLEAISEKASASLAEAMRKAEMALAEETKRANDAVAALQTSSSSKSSSDSEKQLEADLFAAKLVSKKALEDMEGYAAEATRAKADAAEARRIAQLAETKAKALGEARAKGGAIISDTNPAAVLAMEKAIADARAFADAAVHVVKADLAKAAETSKKDSARIKSLTTELQREAVESARIIAGLQKLRDAEIEKARVTNKKELEIALASADADAKKRVQQAVDSGVKDLASFKQQSADALAAAVAAAKADAARALTQAVADTEARLTDAVAEAEAKAKQAVSEAERRAELEFKRIVAGESTKRQELETRLAATEAEMLPIRAAVETVTAVAAARLEEALAEAEAIADAAAKRIVADELVKQTELEAKLAAASLEMERRVAASADEVEAERRNSGDAYATVTALTEKIDGLAVALRDAETNVSAERDASGEARASLAKVTKASAEDGRKISALTAELKKEAVESARIISGLRKLADADMAKVRFANAQTLQRALASAETDSENRVQAAVNSGTQNLVSFKLQSAESLQLAVGTAKADAAQVLANAVAEAEQRLADAVAAETRRAEASIAEAEATTSEATKNAVAAVTNKVDELQTSLRDTEERLELADRDAIAAKNAAVASAARVEAATTEFSAKLVSTEQRLQHARDAAVAAKASAEMFKKELELANLEIATAAMSTVSASANAVKISTLSQAVASLETELVSASARAARAESEVESARCAVDAASSDTKDTNATLAKLREELSVAQRQAANAERSADALAAKLANSVPVTSDTRSSAADATGGRLVSSGQAVADRDVDVSHDTTDVTSVTSVTIDTSNLVVLSKMKKTELIDELETRGLPTRGIVSELRQRLRDARADDEPQKGNRKKMPKTVGPNEQKLKCPLSSYMLFAKETRPGVLVAMPGLSVGDVGKELGARWKGLGDDDRETWSLKASSLKSEYEISLQQARTKDAALTTWRVDGSTSETTKIETTETTTMTSTEKSTSSSVSTGGNSYYQVIDGERYDRKVLEDCRRLMAVGDVITLEEAKLIIKDVYDGPVKMQKRGVESSVTDIELATLRYAHYHFKWTKEAETWIFSELYEKMETGLGEIPGTKGYYRVINGNRYDRKVLEECAAAMDGDGVIDVAEANTVYKSVIDGPTRVQRRGVTSSVTDCELATLRFAHYAFNWTKEADEYMFTELYEKMLGGVADVEETRAGGGAKDRKKQETQDSYYRVIDGTRVDTVVLRSVETRGAVSLFEAKKIVQELTDVKKRTAVRGVGVTSKITKVEMQTLRYSSLKFGWSEEAQAYLGDTIAEEGE